MMARSKRVCVMLLGLASVLSLMAPALGDDLPAGWSETDRTDCQIWIPESSRAGQAVTWSGACAGGKAQGQGEMLLSYRDEGGKQQTQSYKGTMLDGKYEGQGVYNYADPGDRYEGQFKNGNYDGQGAYIVSDDLFYEGQFRDGVPNGHGVFYLDNGVRYEGQIRNGLFNGHGVLIFADGGRHEGQWKDGKADGQGLLVYSDGRSYRGPFVNNAAHGIGDCVDKDGSAGKCEYSGGTFIRWME
jgi:hypothetical protein